MNVKWVIVNQFGINPKKAIRAIFNIPRFMRDLRKFKKTYKGHVQISPCLTDWYDQAGDAESEYFVQDLLVAQIICKNNPGKHVDIGSRIDGFVSNLASFREIEIFDIREVKNKIKNVSFKQRDITLEDPVYDGYSESLSCLHSLEHFGLGRYGDPIRPDGYIDGFNNMAKMVTAGGRFYLSVPLGSNERVEFNALRVFNIATILGLAGKNGFTVEEFHTVKDGAYSSFTGMDDSIIAHVNAHTYILGIFIFNKPRGGQ